MVGNPNVFPLYEMSIQRTDHPCRGHQARLALGFLSSTRHLAFTSAFMLVVDETYLVGYRQHHVPRRPPASSTHLSSPQDESLQPAERLDEPSPDVPLLQCD
eukprot:1036187-Pleurochrysis_carterae.AAC.4